MMEDLKQTKLVKECIEIATRKFSENQNGKFDFHNLEHTLNVFEAITAIAENTEQVCEREKELLQVAALFHDIYACIDLNDHEKESAKFAREVLRTKHVPEEDIALVERLIKTTKLGTGPTDLMEEIIKDADVSHLGSKNYFTVPFINLFREINKFKEKLPNVWGRRLC